MFGFLRLTPGDRDQRRAYARCCQAQHLLYGVTALPWLSYEGVLTYFVAIDSGAAAPPRHDEPTCCRLRTTRSLLAAPDARFTAFAAAVGLLLAGVKAEDDRRDSGSMISRMVDWFIRSRARQARKTLDGFDSGLTRRLDALVAEHLRIEQSANRARLVDVVRPTAECFAELFATLGRMLTSVLDDAPTKLRPIGDGLGAAIIAADCALDWQKDLRQGNFNPVRSHAAAADAWTMAGEQLQRAATAARSVFGEEGLSVRLLRFNVERLSRYASVREVATCEQTLERWGFRREPGYVYAGCDAPCDCMCALDGAGCDSCCCEAFADSGCLCDCCGGGCDPGGCGTTQQRKDRKWRPAASRSNGDATPGDSGHAGVA